MHASARHQRTVWRNEELCFRILILPVLEGHSVKRVYSLTEVFDDNENKIKQDQAAAFTAVQDRITGSCRKVGVPTADKQFGLHESQLYSWRSKARLAQDRSAVEERLLVENARLKRQLAEQAEELAIVKKAAAYFAKSLK